MSKLVLHLDWCSHAAARYAVEHWHYSHSLPTPPLVKVGAWEDGRFIGVILFSRGGNNNMLRPFNLSLVEGCELTRIALNIHRAPVSQLVRIAVHLLKKQSPGLRLVVSYADPNHGHHGGIYQALSWIYTGQTASDAAYVDSVGRRWHSRQVSHTGVSRQYGSLRHVPKHEECQKIALLGKHRYLYPLDAAMRQQ